MVPADMSLDMFAQVWRVIEAQANVRTLIEGRRNADIVNWYLSKIADGHVVTGKDDKLVDALMSQGLNFWRSWSFNDQMMFSDTENYCIDNYVEIIKPDTAHAMAVQVDYDI